MTLQPGTYAFLRPGTGGSVLDIRTLDAPREVTDPRRWLPVVMTPKPNFNSSTQMVKQNGWTVNGAEVNPVWVIHGISRAELDALKAGAATSAQVQRVLAYVLKQALND